MNIRGLSKMMRKVLFILVLIIFIILILNIKVTTYQGINYEVHILKIPLYLKILDFFDRHYNYKELVKRIVNNAETDQESVIKIFEWTYNDIKKVPLDLPVIDDHIWYTIVRGYGARDQFSDIFTTLCNHAGVEAFFSPVYDKGRNVKIILSYVKIDNKWRVFDPYNGVYIKNKNGGLASIEQIKSGDWLIHNISNSDKLDFDYGKFLGNLPDIKNMGLHRANIQSPLRRIIFEIKNTYKGY